MADLTVRIERYAEWLDTQRLVYFRGREIANLARNTRLGVRNDIPRVEVWHRIVPTLRLLDDLRLTLGYGIVPHSAYRSRAYNAAVGGVGDSQHTRNVAVDFHGVRGTPREWADALRSMRDRGRFLGGIGVYGTFVHVDTRGTNADWSRA